MVYVSRDDVSPRSFSALFSVRRYPSERALELRGFAEEKALEIRIEATPEFQGTDKRQTGRDVPFFFARLCVNVSISLHVKLDWP